jgi:dCMP deaminase
VIVDQGKRVLSTGYNGPVSGLPNDMVPLVRPDKYDWFIHAEDNAVAFARCDLRGATAYVTGTPCAPCFRRLLQVGIRRIVQGTRESACLNEREINACRAMANALGVDWVTLGTP